MIVRATKVNSTNATGLTPDFVKECEKTVISEIGCSENAYLFGFSKN